MISDLAWYWNLKYRSGDTHVKRTTSKLGTLSDIWWWMISDWAWYWNLQYRTGETYVKRTTSTLGTLSDIWWWMISDWTWYCSNIGQGRHILRELRPSWTLCLISGNEQYRTEPDVGISNIGLGGAECDIMFHTGCNIYWDPFPNIRFQAHFHGPCTCLLSWRQHEMDMHVNVNIFGSKIDDIRFQTAPILCESTTKSPSMPISCLVRYRTRKPLVRQSFLRYRH